MAVIGYIFTAAGYQYVGVGKDVYDRSWGMRQYYDKISKAHPDFKINMLSFLGPKEQLMLEDNGVLINFAYGMGCYEVLKQYKVIPEQMSGFRSGEFASLSAGGGVSFGDMMALLFKKQDLAAKEMKRENFINLLVNGLDTSKTSQIASELNKTVKTEIVSYNMPDSATVMCEVSVKDRLKTVFTSLKGSVIELPYEEISNCSLLAGVAEKLEPDFKAMAMDKPLHKLICQTTGEYYENVPDIRAKFLDYLYKPARMDAVAATMIKNAVNTFVEVGCGTFLGRVVKKIDSGKRVLSTHDMKAMGLVVKLAN
jgi:[acyl-carrier-protein] S-malonyltransferase